MSVGWARNLTFSVHEHHSSSKTSSKSSSKASAKYFLKVQEEPTKYYANKFRSFMRMKFIVDIISQIMEESSSFSSFETNSNIRELSPSTK